MDQENMIREIAFHKGLDHPNIINFIGSFDS